jgi:TnpA family transposase
LPTREVLSPAQRAELLTVPSDLSDRELARYYTLTDDDRAVIARHRGPHNRLGFSVQLCYLRFPGWPWDPAVPLPASIVAYIAGQLDLDPAHLEAYAIRDPTRREHLAEIQRVFGFRPFSMGRYRELSRWLLPTALATDVGAVLVGATLRLARR